jgi:uncharacterized membrane protein YkvI
VKVGKTLLLLIAVLEAGGGYANFTNLPSMLQVLIEISTAIAIIFLVVFGRDKSYNSIILATTIIFLVNVLFGFLSYYYSDGAHANDVPLDGILILCLVKAIGMVVPAFVVHLARNYRDRCNNP